VSRRAAVTERVVVLAPAARDGPITSALLEKAGFECALAPDVEQLCALVEAGAGAVLVAEEALTHDAVARLAALLAAQEPWSDLPVIVFTAEPGARALRRPALDTLALAGNVTLLDRPIRVVTLLSAVRTALRARRRQHAARGVVEELAAALRERDHFLALLGHELRNPLAAVVTAADLLERGAGDLSRARAIIARQSRKLSRLVDDLLEVSRVVSGKIALRRAPIDLRAVVARALEPMEELAERAGVRIEPALPPEPVVVDADAVRLDQVVGNLLSNAVKYTPRGGTVAVTIEASGASAMLRVRDTGIGIPPDMLERIFDTFSQVDASMSRSEGGLGLGLSLVRGLVALHGGEVHARSDGPGRGSEFVVELPLAPRGEASAPAPSRAPAARGVPRRVLVVEDQEDNRDALMMLIEQLGHAVKGVSDGPAGVRAALAMRPDVALVDIGLPGCDGYEVARRVRAALGEGVRLVAVTGYGQAADRQRARAAGFDLHITKPVDLETLVRVLDGAPEARAPGEG
jgi:signal transduction histidine kinase/ActR/RegA family two-component response regulator